MNEENETIQILYNSSNGGWGLSEKAEKAFGEIYKQKINNDSHMYYLYFSLECRHDPILIQIYNDLGKDFDDKFSHTKIITIPKKY